MESIKIYYNGFKINGSKELVKAHFSIDGRTDGKECVHFWGRDYNDLPRGYGFNVTNDSDSQTDYFCEDFAAVFPEHPLYKFLRYAALKDDYLFAKRMLKNWKESDYHQFTKESYEKKVADFEKLENPGQPTEQDMKNVEEFIAKKAQEKAAKEQAEQEQREADAMIERLETEITIKTYTEMFPTREGEAVVLVPFSERPGIEDNSRWSLKAADLIFRDLDAREHAKHSGYDKTDFEILYRENEDDGIHYRGRYDIGDGEGGLLKHIYNFAEWYRTHGEFGKVLENPPETTDNMELYKKIEQLCNA